MYNQTTQAFCCVVVWQAAGELALRLNMSLAAPKVLLLELAERAAVATTVRATPGAQRIQFHASWLCTHCYGLAILTCADWLDAQQSRP